MMDEISVVAILGIENPVRVRFSWRQLGRVAFAVDVEFCAERAPRGGQLPPAVQWLHQVGWDPLAAIGPVAVLPVWVDELSEIVLLEI